MIKAVKQKHLFFDKKWFIFPIAIQWESYIPAYIPSARRLSVHFLWWHFRWTFIVERKDGF